MRPSEFEESSSIGSGAEPDRKTSPLEVVAVLALVGGLLGYGGYQEILPILQARAKPSPSPSPTASPTLPSLTATPAPRSSLAPSPLPTLPSLAPTAPSLAPAPEPGSSDIYQRAPKNGVYYAQNPQLNQSRREIVSSNGRFCIKIVDAPIAPQPGPTRTRVSSLSFRQDGLYVDATGEKLQFDRSYTEMSDSRGTWLWLEGKGDRAGASAECLAAPGNFVGEEPN